MGFFDSFKGKKEAPASSGTSAPDSGMPMPPLPSHPVKNVPTTNSPRPGPQPTPAPAQTQKPIQPQKPQIPDILPTMPSLYTQTFQPQYEENIPFFSEAKAEPSHDDFNFDDLPVVDTESNQELFKGFKTKKPKQPLYIRTDFYSQILTNLDTMVSYVTESKETINSLETLKRNADIEHKKYKRTVEDLQRKLIYIDRVLFK